CDRVVIMNKGKLVADGTTEMLKGKKSGDHMVLITLETIEQKKVKDLFKGINGITISSIEETEDSTLVTLNTTEDQRANIYKVIKKEDWILLEMVQEKKSLEHIFKELTKEI
ncbi:MAG: hypothetical protein KAH95_00160, partial [Spirochaetales bacterium]|nr:hypothetical protein [Spirochaetales bacterium]